MVDFCLIFVNMRVVGRDHSAVMRDHSSRAFCCLRRRVFIDPILLVTCGSRQVISDRRPRSVAWDVDRQLMMRDDGSGMERMGNRLSTNFQRTRTGAPL